MIISLIIAFSISFILLLLLLNTKFAHFAMDLPNHRSLHTALTPRTGGLAIMLGVLCAFFWFGGQWIWIILLISLLLVSLCDDIFHLPVRWRFGVQCIASLCFVLILIPLQSMWLTVLAVITLVWMTNLFNFMDGADGLAGGMTVIGFATYAFAAYAAGNTQIALISGCIVSSALAFLIFNFHPAKIFMGDAGSIPLGFLAGAIGLLGWQQGTWALWFPILIFSPFIVDATVTLLKRALRGKKVWQAHREHYYQRLILAGWGHKKTALAEYLLMIFAAGSAIFGLNTPYIYPLLALWVIIYVVLMVCIDKHTA